MKVIIKASVWCSDCASDKEFYIQNHIYMVLHYILQFLHYIIILQYIDTSIILCNICICVLVYA